MRHQYFVMFLISIVVVNKYYILIPFVAFTCIFPFSYGQIIIMSL